jgi:hypothetical protein
VSDLEGLQSRNRRQEGLTAEYAKYAEEQTMLIRLSHLVIGGHGADNGRCALRQGEHVTPPPGRRPTCDNQISMEQTSSRFAFRVFGLFCGLSPS